MRIGSEERGSLAQSAGFERAWHQCSQESASNSMISSASNSMISFPFLALHEENLPIFHARAKISMPGIHYHYRG